MILTFDDCRLPNSQVLGEVDGGFDVMNTWLYATRITVAAMCVGRARRVFDLVFNMPLIANSLVSKLVNSRGSALSLLIWSLKLMQQTGSLLHRLGVLMKVLKPTANCFSQAMRRNAGPRH